MRALDEPRHVCNHEGLLVRLLAHGHHAQVRLQRRERIVGDLGLCAAEMREISVDLPAFG